MAFDAPKNQLHAEVQAIRDRQRAKRAEVMQGASNDLAEIEAALDNKNNTEEAQRAEEITELEEKRAESDRDLRDAGIN